MSDSPAPHSPASTHPAAPLPATPAGSGAYPSRVLGVLAGGAAGDALGYTVEFSSLEQIRTDHGDAGLTHPLQVPAVRDGGSIPVSDDTQMTLFVLDGLLDWIEWANEGSMADPAASVWLSCLRWYRTQTGQIPEGAPQPPARWLDDHPELNRRRGPGNACLTGLSSPDMGLPRQPQNPDAKGCGTVMRSAPYGMVPGLEDHLVVSLARQGAVLTHGHPAAWSAAAAFALMVSRLMAGGAFPDAVAGALDWLDTVPDDGGTAAAVRAAVALAGSGDHQRAGADSGEATGPASSPGMVSGVLPAELGEGWVAEEALAVAVYSVLATGGAAAQPTAHFRAALALALNHAGDSDSTAALTGQLLGAHYGMAIFPDGAVPTWIGEHAVIVEAAERWTAATS